MHMVLETNQVHISSLVVHCLPGKFEQVLANVKKMDQVEIHAPDPVGKFVVLLETDNEQGILAMIDQIQTVNGVLNTTMVYHEIDDGTEGEKGDENHA